MLNHARTLLVNRSGSVGFNPNILLEEIVPADYVSRPLPSYIQAIRRVIYGANPDAHMLNWRTHELMAMLHASELEEFILELDPRITYSFDPTTAVSDKNFVPQIKRIDTASDHNELYLSGDPPAPDYSGRMFYSWRIEWDTSEATSTATLLSPLKAQVNSPTFSSGLSSLMSLPGTDLTYRHHNPASDSRFHYSQLFRPVLTLADLVPLLEELNGENLLELFGVGTSRATTEPFKTFYALWRGHYALPYKLGGLVLALIYRTDEIAA